MRVWFPEMLEKLKRYWKPSMPWGKVIAFCERMTVMRKELAMSKDIKPPMIHCFKCGTRARAAYPKISVRSLIFNLPKVDAATPEELKDIERDWKKFKRANGLDGYGRKKT